MMLHAMLARWVGPEFALSEPEALQLARDYCGWRQHYGGILDPKNEALITLLMTIGVIEGPRLMRVQARRKAQARAARAERDARAASLGGTVVQMDGRL